MDKYFLFLDESGDHNLKVIDNDYPIFVLGGIIVEENYYKNQMKNAVKSFSKGFFKNDNVILHTREITRNKGYFEILKVTTVRNDFYRKINKLINSLNFAVLAVIIKKQRLKKQYIHPFDSYHISFHFILERFIFYLRERKAIGSITAEQRGSKLDKELRLEYNKLQLNGTRYVKPSEINQKIGNNFYIEPKNPNNVGLQIADLIVSPIGRYGIGKKMHQDFEIIKSKLIKKGATSQYEGYGLKIFPK